MAVSIRKPAWLNKKINLEQCYQMQALLNDLSLNTVCQQARCPNISECFSKGGATFLILGKVCTRNCRFCAVEKGKPAEVDLEEPQRIAEAVRRLNLRHVVITSVTRDDLPLGGAEVFVRTISAIREKTGNTTIEVLIPDFKLNPLKNHTQTDSANAASNRVNIPAIEAIVNAGPEIIGHNVETVPRLYNLVRPGADCYLSLEVLRIVKELTAHIYTKSAIMLGLGEKKQEVLELFYELRKVKCDFLSMGQYLSPGINHFPVKEYINPQDFIDYKQIAARLGFLHVKSSAYVRSSYLASEYLDVGYRGN